MNKQNINVQNHYGKKTQPMCLNDRQTNKHQNINHDSYGVECI